MQLMYRFFYIIMFLLYAPKLFYEWVTGRKTSSWFRYRFFSKPIRPLESLYCIWIHAVSVGEILAVEPIIRELEKDKKYRLILSTVTMTGMETIQKRMPELQESLFLPFDFPWVIRRLFRYAAPNLIILSEGDIWPEFLMQAKRKGSKVAIINAKLSDRSYRRMTKIPSIGRWLLSYADLICSQNDLYAKRFQRLISKRVTLLVTGNTKGDTLKSSLSDVIDLKKKLDLKNGPVITIASSHYPEEQKLIQSLLPILAAYPEVRVLVVPRHPHRFESVFDSLLKMDFGLVEKYSTLKNGAPWRVLIVDQMGLLERMYSVSTIAFICGSFIETVGGHNIIEAAQWGVPCIVGPCMHAQKSLMEIAEKMNAVLQIASYDQACEVVQMLLSDSEKRLEQSQASLRLAERVQGASKRCLHAIHLLINGS